MWKMAEVRILVSIFFLQDLVVLYVFGKGFEINCFFVLYIVLIVIFRGDLL